MSKHASNLKSTQHLLWKLISYPEGVGKGLAHYGHPRLPVRGDRRLGASARLNIYANMYFYRIRDNLKEDFPGILKLLGEDRFHNLVTDYLLAHPSGHWSLRYAGQHLALFLKRHPLMKRWPFIIELARLEWALIQAFDAADAPVLTAADLKKVPAGKWASLRLGLVPSVLLLSCRYGIDVVRERLIKRGGAGYVAVAATHLLVWRHGLAVVYRRVTQDEWRALQAIRREKKFGEVCKEGSPGKITLYLRRWLSEQLLFLSK